jgi:sulfoxide reductase heme-binding subunit YedZ
VSVTFTWYLVRAGGLVAFALLTCSVLAGLLLSGRARLSGCPRFAVEDVHRFLGLLAGCFVALHVLALLVDSYLPFSLVSLVVPGAAPYRPLATAIGVVALELLAAVALTNRFRRRLPYRFWRRAHSATFAVWGLALAHGLAAGTDARDAWALAVFATAAAAVAAAAVWRAVPRTSRGLLWPVAAAVVGVEVVVALALGPLGRPAQQAQAGAVRRNTPSVRETMQRTTGGAHAEDREDGRAVESGADS